MKTKGKRPEGIVFTNADPRYAGKLDDPQGGDATMLMQQVREVMTVNQEMTDESSWIWLTSEQMGFPLRSEFANENHGEAGNSKQCNDQRTDQTAFFLAPIITDFIRNTKKEHYDCWLLVLHGGCYQKNCRIAEMSCLPRRCWELSALQLS